MMWSFSASGYVYRYVHRLKILARLISMGQKLVPFWRLMSVEKISISRKFDPIDM